MADLLIKSKAVETYDFILFDCPPSLGLMTLNAFTASTDILIPLVAEVLPFKGLTMINDFIKMVHARLNPQAHVSALGLFETELPFLELQFKLVDKPIRLLQFWWA